MGILVDEARMCVDAVTDDCVCLHPFGRANSSPRIQLDGRRLFQGLIADSPSPAILSLFYARTPGVHHQCCAATFIILMSI